MRDKIKKRKLGSYPYFSVIFSTTLILLVLGVFGYTIIYSFTFLSDVKEDLRFTIYIQKNTTKNEIKALEAKISKKPYIAKKKDSIKYVSKEVVAHRYFIDTGEDFQDLLDKNPFRDYISVAIDNLFFNTTSLESIQTALLKESIVYEVVYPKNIVDTVYKKAQNISIILFIILAILILVNYLLISNSIKLALYSQRFLIRSMQLVGAQSGFIKRPFMLRAFFHGQLSGIIAAAILYATHHFVVVLLFQQTFLHNILPNILILSGILITFGALVCLFSANIAIKKYLGMSLNQLY